jgi:outer membrane protein OmpA-like peptidoglycan-associated protein
MEADMRGRVVSMLLLFAVAAFTTACATKGWVREVVGKQSAETERRFGDVDSKMTAESTRVATLETTVGETGGVARGAREQADAALQRADAAHTRAEGADIRAHEVDSRLSRLWSARHVRTKVETLDVTFGFNRADLNDGAQTALVTLARELQANPALTVDLTGYTDSRGHPDYNVQLSERRVDAVRRFLVKHGVELPRINAIGLGVLDDRGVPDAKKRRVSVHVMLAAE